MMRPWMGIGLTAFVCLCPWRTPAAPSAAIVFKDLKVADIRLSPSGRYMSSIMDFNGSMNLVVIDLADKTSTAITRYPPPGKVLTVRWKSDETLVYVSTGDAGGLEEHDVWAINRHGKDNRNLFHWMPSDNDVEFRGIIDWLPEVTNTVLAAVAHVDLINVSDPHFFRIVRLAVGPGGTTREEVVAGGRECNYVVDHEGNPRVCLSKELDLRRRLYYRDRAKSPWRELSTFKYGDGEVTPLAFTADNKHLYVLSNFHRNTRALFEFDPESNGLTGPLVEVPDADLAQGVFGNDGRSLIGVRYFKDREHVYYLDDAMAALQKSMDAAFPTRHVAIQSVSDDFARAIIKVESDQSPGQFYLYENAKHSLEKLADRAPWIDPSQFGQQKAVRFVAKDGTALHGYLTLPPDREAKALPLILWPSGGPGSRATDGWNPMAQFFATRGYAVLRVNQRGASGYDREFDAMGKSLSLEGMRTDLLDSIEWAVSVGIIAKDRVALYGTDFNGYLALMAMAGAPGAYRCVISYAGLINLEHLFDKLSISRSLWRERSDTEVTLWENLLGGHRDAAFLKGQSPLYNSDKIRGPVFLAYSVNDTLVPYSDAEELKYALERAHKSVVLLAKDQEPHLFDKEQDKIDLFSKIEPFLQGCNPSR
jgi:dipeptidyl aminopeptidase/acylaminoacyl peptidase